MRLVLCTMLLGLCAVSAIGHAADEGWRAAVAKEPAKAKLSIWQRHVEKDAMTDKENSSWTAWSRNTIPDTINRPVSARLVARCHNGKTELFVGWGRFITTGDSGGGHEMTLRIGSRPMEKHAWSMSTDFKSMFSQWPIEHLKAMRNESRLLAETIPYGSGPVRAEFALDGVEEVVDDISRRCEWTKREHPTVKAEWRCASRNRFGTCTGYVRDRQAKLP